MQITGEFRSVQNALFQVTGSIRDHLLLSGVFREVTVKSPHLRLSEGPLRNEPVPHNVSAPSSPRFQLPQVKIPSFAVVFSFSRFLKDV